MQAAGRAMCRDPKDAHMVARLHRVFSPPAKDKIIMPRQVIFYDNFKLSFEILLPEDQQAPEATARDGSKAHEKGSNL